MTEMTNETESSAGTMEIQRPAEPSFPDTSAGHLEVVPTLDGGRTKGRIDRRRQRPVEKVHHTRIGGAWAAVATAVGLGGALIDFVVQNTRSVRVEFFSASGRMPIAVAMLAAALAGAAVVLIVGICRTTQLRFVLRRHRRGVASEPKDSEFPSGTAIDQVGE